MKFRIGLLAFGFIILNSANAQIKLLDSLRAIKKQVSEIKLPSVNQQPLPMEFGDTVKSYDGYESAIISEDGQQVLVKMSRPTKCASNF